MTAIKQVAICSAAHMKSLGGYLDRSNDRHEVLDMDSQHLNDPASWEREFDRTREAYGHNKAGKAGAKCTYCYHQIIGFNPSECDLNGGRLAPRDCMAFAREWVERYYPNQEAVWALHREHCAADGTDRYAVHVAINRTDLETGKRLDEGRASRQRTLHASRMRDMDGRWGLAQMEKGARNSAHHARQQSRGEQRAREAGLAGLPRFETDLDHVRRVVRESVREVAKGDEPNKMRALNEALERRGIHMRLSRDTSLKSRDVVFEYRPTYDRRGKGGERVQKASISGRKLGRGYSLTGIQRGLGIAGRLVMEAAKTADRAMDNGQSNEMW